MDPSVVASETADEESHLPVCPHWTISSIVYHLHVQLSLQIAQSLFCPDRMMCSHWEQLEDICDHSSFDPLPFISIALLYIIIIIIVVVIGGGDIHMYEYKIYS